MRSMDVMRPGESTSLGVITSQCFIFALFKTHRDRFRGHARPCSAASASRRRHARVGAWPCCRAPAQVVALRRRRCDPSLLKLRKGCEACLNSNCTAQRLVFAAQHARELAG